MAGQDHPDPRVIAAAIRGHQPLPPMPSGLTLADGYAVQAEVAPLVSPAGFAGIKAGVTNPALQKNFGINHALLGRLYESGRITPGTQVPNIDGRLLECEIGIIVGRNGEPVSACLTVEIAFLKFAGASDATAPNLVAGNVATDAFIAGEPVPFEAFSGGSVYLYRDDELINEADITESLGGPERALSWIRDEAARYNMELKEGALVMTGACGKVVPALPGEYRVVCDTLCDFAFTISR